jgi:hypothetical protein
MSEIVRCEICGGMYKYNRRYLSGHKRLSHGKRNVASLLKSERERLRAIFALYMNLSDKNKRRVRERLTI